MENIKILNIDSDRLDYSNVVEIEKQMNELIKSGAKAILVDMGTVNYMDSRSVGLFIAFKMQCEGKNVFLGFYNLLEDVVYIFNVTNVASVLNIYNTKDEAIAEAEETLNE